MTLRDRILAVYRGERPDVVPFMLDLSHWFYHREQRPWDLSAAYEQPELELIDCHRRLGCGFYMPNLASFYSISFPEDVTAETEKQHRPNGAPEIIWRLSTPRGTIERRRVWEPTTYAWGVSRWGIRDERDLSIWAEALAHRRYAPKWDNYHAWLDAVGDLGVVYVPGGYSAMGRLLNYWMGIEGVVYATMDFPDAMHEAVQQVNANNLELIDLLVESPAEIIIMGDNFSSDIQPPSFFAEWSKAFYDDAVRRLHAAGKSVAVHIDGRLRGAIDMIRQTGADCGDAITPQPMGDLSPAECRAEAGPDFILSGGPSPDLWLPSVPLDVFKAKAIEWLETRHQSPRLIANAGDQVPPGAEWARIEIMRDLVEQHGRYD
jgi:hypothetical protein